MNRLSKSTWLCLVLGGYWLLLWYHLSAQWTVYEQYNYGWAVPFLCLLLFWRNLRCFASPTPPASRPAPAPQSGLPSAGSQFPALVIVVILVCLAYLPVRWLHEANPIWRLTSWVWALLLVALTLALLQLAGGSELRRRVQGPVACSLVAVPWPTPLEVWLVQGLTHGSVALNLELLGWLGIPALQKGNVIELATGLVGIDEACSGIRSFQATLMLAFFFSLYRRLSRRRTLLLVGLGLGLAFALNVGRTFLLVVVAARQGVPAINRWHDPAGIIILLVCFTALWWGAGQLGRRSGPGADSPAPGDAGLLSSQFSLWLPLGLGLWLVAVEAATEFWYRAQERRQTAGQNWSVRWPEQAAHFEDVGFTAPVRKMLRFDAGENFRWQDEVGRRWQGFYLRWRPGHSVYDRVRVSLSKSHSPEVCLQAAGMELQSELAPVRVAAHPRLALSFRHYVFRAERTPVHVFLSVAEDMATGDTTGYFRTSHAERFRAALAGSRNVGQRTLEIAVWGSADAATAEAAFRELVQKLVIVE